MGQMQKPNRRNRSEATSQLSSFSPPSSSFIRISCKATTRVQGARQAPYTQGGRGTEARRTTQIHNLRLSLPHAPQHPTSIASTTKIMNGPRTRDHSQNFSPFLPLSLPPSLPPSFHSSLYSTYSIIISNQNLLAQRRTARRKSNRPLPLPPFLPFSLSPISVSTLVPSKQPWRSVI